MISNPLTVIEASVLLSILLGQHQHTQARHNDLKELFARGLIHEAIPGLRFGLTQRGNAMVERMILGTMEEKATWESAWSSIKGTCGSV